MIKLTPVELHSIINAAYWQISRHPEQYTLARPKVQKILKWLISINWDEPNTECIFIDEVPF